ncbi:MAG: CinA family protein [Propionibacteriaceae bacterium]
MSHTELIARLAERAETLGTVESLTAGLVAAAITEVPGASTVFRGGLVTYATELKVALAGVPAEVAAAGVVTQATAQAMAEGGRRSLGVTWCCATTGIAGPGSYEGILAGTVWIAVAGPHGTITRLLELGDLGRSEVRGRTVTAVLDLAEQYL